ncbi:DUF3800 domain-containing protein [Erysipelothrix aquatica]|uniref:DUF3800 domain-containing protein n=1 Tax=Erysipelothrix aquatica TaxID=2683714 RepID=UPI001359715A|nr:DUF3800 domain-containing protein [Erysipelothrix aquatica]
MQNVFFYIDDSGVFGDNNTRYFIYAGYVFFSTQEKNNAARKYSSVEKSIKSRTGLAQTDELKSYGLTPKLKGELYRSLNGFQRFSCIIDSKRVNRDILSHKKHKQRFLDYALKRTIKSTLQSAGNHNHVDLSKPINVHIFFDEHTTATSGKYELKEAISAELIDGSFNYNYQKFFEPILVKGSSVNLTLCNSANTLLVRASDIVANKSFYEYNHSGRVPTLNHFCCSKHP